MEFELVLPTIKDMGLEEKGKIHRMVDAQFIHYMRLIQMDHWDANIMVVLIKLLKKV